MIFKVLVQESTIYDISRNDFFIVHDDELGILNFLILSRLRRGLPI